MSACRTPAANAATCPLLSAKHALPKYFKTREHSTVDCAPPTPSAAASRRRCSLCRAFVSAYDWLNTSLAGLNVTVWVNNSDVGGGEEAGAHPPSVQRWTQPVNLAGAFPLGLYCRLLAVHLAWWCALRLLPVNPVMPQGANSKPPCALMCCSQCVPEAAVGARLLGSAGWREGHASRLVAPVPRFLLPARTPLCDVAAAGKLPLKYCCSHHRCCCWCRRVVVGLLRLLGSSAAASKQVPGVHADA